MLTVPLGGKKAAGRIARVDDADYDLVIAYRWHIVSSPRPDTVWALTSIWRDGRRTTQAMHVMITGWRMTDHVNGDGLDNQRHNLRPCTQSQNNRNQKPTLGCASPYKGVARRSREDPRWRAIISMDGKHRILGMFDDEISAALAYDAAARELFGSYARTNFPEAA
jgi:hypothetical protein